MMSCVEGVAKARTSHDDKLLLKSYIKIATLSEPMKCFKTLAQCRTHKIHNHLCDIGSDTGETDWLGDLGCERSENIAGGSVVAD